MINALINNTEQLLTNIIYPKNNSYKIHYGSSAIQGLRDHMEDTKRVVRINVPNIKTCYLIILCDGHGGDKCSKFIIQILPKLIEQKIKLLSHNYSNLLIELYINELMDDLDKLFSQLNDKSGSTCVIGLFIDNDLYISNTGDSRCIIGNTYNELLFSTTDHKPELSLEKNRIEEHGGKIMNIDVARVYINEHVNGLAMSRAIGDLEYKNSNNNIVICNPDIIFQNIIARNEFIILASDGLWDVINNNEAIYFVNKYLTKISLKQIAIKLTKLALQKGSTDNVTVIIVMMN